MIDRLDAGPGLNDRELIATRAQAVRPEVVFAVLDRSGARHVLVGAPGVFHYHFTR